MVTSAANAAAPRRPRVTVVVATYNRSNVLRYALDSLVAQSHSDWEAVIVGDRCTDDSEAVVASFGDARNDVGEPAPQSG